MTKQNYILGAVIIVVIIVAFVFAGQSADAPSALLTESATSTQPLATTSPSQPSVGTQNSPTIPGLPQGAIVEVIESRQAPTLTVENVTLKLGETRKIGVLSLTVKSIKDTRCSGSTRCTDIGDARVLLGVSGPVTTKNVSFIEQQAFEIDDMKVTLTNVLPNRKYGETIADASYEFYITIESVE